MGFFDKLLGGQGSENVKFDEREGYAAVLLATVAADGHISDEEAQSFNGIVNRMQLFRSQSGSDFSAMLDRLLGLLKKNGVGFLLEKGAEAINPQLRETAFATAVDLVLADGRVEDEEKQFLESIKTNLNISDQLAEMIVEVMMIKNRG